MIVEHYETKALEEAQYQNDLLKRAKKGIIPEGNSDIIHWHRWSKFSLASDLTEGSGGDPGSGLAMDATDLKCKLVEFGSYVRIPLFGDAIRLDSAIKESYTKFNEQAQRTANRRLMTSLVLGSNSVTGNSFSALTKRYAGGAADFATLVASPKSITNKDISSAVAYVEKNVGPQGPVYVTLDPFTKEDLMVGDADFRDMLKHNDLEILKRNNLPMWAGGMLDRQDEPWRESSAGSEGTYSASGDVVTVFIYKADAIGAAQLMGKGGLKPKFHVQNISPTGAEITIGYRIPFKGAVLNNVWGVQLRGITRDASVSSVA